jgi:hypothetical protein
MRRFKITCCNCTRSPRTIEIRFTHESPHQTSEHARIFGAPVRFGCATNAFVIERVSGTTGAGRRSSALRNFAALSQ